MGNFAFNSVPTIRHSRSRFDLSHSVKTSGNVGTLYPFEVQEVYPGDTFKVKTNVVTRLTSQFLRPVMDNLFLDIYYFYVPSRIIYDKFVNIFGENTESAWASTVDYSVPTLSGRVIKGTVADYMGLPIDMDIKDINILPFRAFAKIYDDWFRDQNNISPMHIQVGERSESEVFNSHQWAPGNYLGLPPKVAKMHDYFTSCLPAPQKGPAPSIPLNISDAPVYPGSAHSLNPTGGSAQPLIYNYTDGTSLEPSSNGLTMVLTPLSSGPGGASRLDTTEGIMLDKLVTPVNLWASVDGAATTVNDLRFAFQFQKMLERDARSGTRFVEYLSSHFGVNAGDARLQRSEFLGGKRTPISVTQVTQTTGANSESSPLGEVGAYSLSGGRSRFTKGFVEHGYVIGVYCIRQFHTYQQGIERFWKRKERVDFFDPVFSNIGEQPVYATELYGSAASDQVFGYNEAWADLRYRPNSVRAQMRSGVVDSLDFWHFADYYSAAPTLNEQFINETPMYVDRAITVQSSVMDQFILDFYIQNIAYRPLPTYSVPSLIDHN